MMKDNTAVSTKEKGDNLVKLYSRPTPVQVLNHTLMPAEDIFNRRALAVEEVWPSLCFCGVKQAFLFAIKTS